MPTEHWKLAVVKAKWHRSCPIRYAMHVLTAISLLSKHKRVSTHRHILLS